MRKVFFTTLSFACAFTWIWVLLFRHNITYNVAAIALLIVITLAFTYRLFDLIVYTRVQKTQKKRNIEHEPVEADAIADAIVEIEDAYKKRYIPLDVDLKKYFPNDAPKNEHHQEPHIGS